MKCTTYSKINWFRRHVYICLLSIFRGDPWARVRFFRALIVLRTFSREHNCRCQFSASTGSRGSLSLVYEYNVGTRGNKATRHNAVPTLKFRKLPLEQTDKSVYSYRCCHHFNITFRVVVGVLRIRKNAEMEVISFSQENWNTNYSYLENMDRPMHTNSPTCVHCMNLFAHHITILMMVEESK